ncbi:hypothetical protein G3I60_05310 [Streptomyces sp. SID13666]|uniref:hypothetical protein n=1 Tax=Streptomyces sp. SID13666 TaxID=2706054 RepID=UPI0013C1B4C8|nr:hypothetical protein [Streptomyces sp. SID13666]NEA53589.1 hypothetical protein [Streptomyces sp. SID13666]
MIIPPGIAIVQVTGRFRHPDGTPFKGTVVFEAPAVIELAYARTVVTGRATAVLDINGEFVVLLVATDNAGMQPTGWAYTVTVLLDDGAPSRTFSLALPSAEPVVDLAIKMPADPSRLNYVPVPGIKGDDGSSVLSGKGRPPVGAGLDGDFWMDTSQPTVWTLYGPRENGVWPASGLNLGGDPAGLIGALNDHRSAPDAHGDRAWATGKFLDKTTGGTVTGPVTVGALTASSLTLPPGTVTSSKTVVFPSPTGATAYAVWRASQPCTVVAVRGYRAGGTGGTINAQNNASDLLPTDLSLSVAATWMSGPSLQNTAMAAGDTLTVKLTGVTGSPSAVTLQVDVQGA